MKCGELFNEYFCKNKKKKFLTKTVTPSDPRCAVLLGARIQPKFVQPSKKESNASFLLPRFIQSDYIVFSAKNKKLWSPSKFSNLAHSANIQSIQCAGVFHVRHSDCEC